MTPAPDNRQIFIAAVLAIIVLRAEAAVFCPLHCICRFTSSLDVIECNGQNLTSPPHLSTLERDTSESKVDLYINRNRLRYILRHSFFSISGRLRTLEILQNEEIIEIAVSAFEPFTSSLEVLRLDPISDNLSVKFGLFSPLTSLVELTISSRSTDAKGQVLSSPLFNLNDFPHLRVLELVYCGLLDIANVSVGKTRLKTLNLSNNKFSEIPQLVTSLAGKSLTRLYMANNKLTRLKSSYIPEGCKLEVLDLSFNKLTAIDREALGKCSQLQIVNLSHNVELVSIEFGAFSGLVNLIIDLDHSSISYLDFIQPDQVMALKIEGSDVPCTCELQVRVMSVLGHRLRGTCVSVADVSMAKTDYEVSILDLDCSKYKEKMRLLNTADGYCNFGDYDCVRDQETATFQRSQTPSSYTQPDSVPTSLLSRKRIPSPTFLASTDAFSMEDSLPGLPVVVTSTHTLKSSSPILSEITPEYTQNSLIDSTQTTFLLLDKMSRGDGKNVKNSPLHALPISPESASTDSSLLLQEETPKLSQFATQLPLESESVRLEPHLEIQSQAKFQAHKESHQQLKFQPSTRRQQQVKYQSPTERQQPVEIQEVAEIELLPQARLESAVQTSLSVLPQRQQEARKASKAQEKTQITPHDKPKATSNLLEELDSQSPLPAKPPTAKALSETKGLDPSPYVSQLSKTQKLVQLTPLEKSLRTSSPDSALNSAPEEMPKNSKGILPTTTSSVDLDTSPEQMYTRSVKIKAPRVATALEASQRKELKDASVSDNTRRVHGGVTIEESPDLEKWRRAKYSIEDEADSTNQKNNLWILHHPICLVACYLHSCLTFMAFLAPKRGRCNR